MKVFPQRKTNKNQLYPNPTINSCIPRPRSRKVAALKGATTFHRGPAWYARVDRGPDSQRRVAGPGLQLGLLGSNEVHVEDVAEDEVRVPTVSADLGLQADIRLRLSRSLSQF